MRARTNLALYPAAASRRSAFWLALALILSIGLTVTHIVWARSDTLDPARLRGEASLLTREAGVRRVQLQDLQEALDPVLVRELADRVDLANELIVRAALDAGAFLAVLEAAAPDSLYVERLSLSVSAEGLRAELTVRADSQPSALELIRNLRRDEAIREVTPVSERVINGGDQLVLSVLYRPDNLRLR